MPKVTFLPEERTLVVKAGANVMNAIIEAGLPIGRSCGAIGICNKCLVQVVKGHENLSKPGALEKKLKIRENITDANLRVSCQTKITGDVSITTSYW